MSARDHSRARAGIGATALLSALALVACSGESASQGNGDAGSPGAAAGGTGGSGPGGSGPGATGGGEPGGSAGTPGAAAQAGSAGDGAAGAAGGAPEPVCGNGAVETGERCDGAKLGGRSCRDFGFETGQLSCSDCQFDTSGCSGTERCASGGDEDGDGLVDCADPDCEASCASVCGAVAELQDPAMLVASTTGQALAPPGTCHPMGETGLPALAYRLTPATTGMLEVRVDTSLPMVVSVGASCEGAAASACAIGGPLSVPVTRGEEVFIQVSGLESFESGTFTLLAASRPISCGDANRDPGEGCDDDNDLDGDGCSKLCQVESSESPVNDTTHQADSFVTPYFGEIDPGDVDVMAVPVSAGARLVADTFDFGDGACSQRQLDSFLELLTPDGTSVLASDDDGGDGYCAHLEVEGLSEGTYYLRVSASPEGTVTEFPYRLVTSISQ